MRNRKMHLTALLVSLVALLCYGALRAQATQEPQAVKAVPVQLTPEQVDRLARHESAINTLDAQLKAAVAEYRLAVAKIRDEACETAGANPLQYKTEPEWTQTGNQRLLVFLPKSAPPATKK